MQLGHERLAEAHDLAIRAAARVEVRPALAAADRHAGQRVLENLLEPQELDDAEVDRGVKAQAALIGTERRIELNAETAVDLHLPGVVDPRHAEDDLAFGFADALDQRVARIIGMLGDDAAKAFEHFVDRLMKLRLACVAPQHFVQNGLQFFVDLAQKSLLTIRFVRACGPCGP